MERLKKRCMLGLGSLLACAALCLPIPAYAYNDVSPQDWYYDAVQQASDAGYMSGYSSMYFGPNDILTRAQAVTVLFNVLADPDYDDMTSNFADVSPQAYYAKPVSWASASGVVAGVSPTQFNPHAPCTREQFAVMMAHGASLVGKFADPANPEATLTKFSDKGAVSSWAKAPLAWANLNGIINGMGDNTVLPQKTLTRAEAAAMVLNLSRTSGTTVTDWRDAALQLPIISDMRASFDHGPKPAAFQKYIVLHDTEGDGNASSVIDWWDSNGNLVAAHFVVNKDGSIYQAVPLDRITHHAGYGDTGHNGLYGISEDGRDDMRGAVPIGSWAADYGMNAWSIGIEMVHVGGSGYYPEAQLQAVDALIAYIDAYYGFPSTIIDHKDWRSYNSDTSPEFAQYLANYKATRTHDGQ